MAPLTRPWPAFSLLFFASQPAEFRRGKFDLFRDSTQFADRHGFEAVWVPERHFHAFGGMFPNPALFGVVLAETTTHVRIRAGSVVMPLHHPVRVAEEWSVVDNLSEGRVDVSFAIGWNPTDFVLAPDAYADRRSRALDGIDIVRRLWAGEELETRNGAGQTVRVQIHPMPRQPVLDVWLTCSGSADRFMDAGERGYNVLTALLFQRVDELRAKISSYRAARAAHGHPGPGKVTLMLHTFVGSDEAAVRAAVREPFKQYLESSVDLWRVGESRLEHLSPRRRADMLEYAFERYYQKTALMGTAASCAAMIESVRDAGVDEIACLIDFGADPAAIVRGLHHLDELRRGRPRAVIG